MVFRALAQEHDDFGAQQSEAPVAFQQFLAYVVVLADLDQLANRLTQAFQGQRDIILDDVWLADAKLGPITPPNRSFPGTERALFGCSLNLVASLFYVIKKEIAVA